jgi:hypothetical protein
MAVTVRRLCAIGLLSAGIGVALAVAASPDAAAAPGTPGSTGGTPTSHQQVLRRSVIAVPHTLAPSSSRKSTSWSAPTSYTYVSSTDGVNQDGAVKHHWGTHHRR